MLGEDVEDQPGAVDRLDLELVLEVAQLAGRQVAVEDHRVGAGGLHDLTQPVDLARPDVRRGVRLGAALVDRVEHLRAGRLGEQRQLGHRVLGVGHGAVGPHADEDDPLEAQLAVLDLGDVLELGAQAARPGAGAAAARSRVRVGRVGQVELLVVESSPRGPTARKSITRSASSPVGHPDRRRPLPTLVGAASGATAGRVPRDAGSGRRHAAGHRRVGQGVSCRSGAAGPGDRRAHPATGGDGTLACSATSCCRHLVACAGVTLDGRRTSMERVSGERHAEGHHAVREHPRRGPEAPSGTGPTRPSLAVKPPAPGTVEIGVSTRPGATVVSADPGGREVAARPTASCRPRRPWTRYDAWPIWPSKRRHRVEVDDRATLAVGVGLVARHQGRAGGSCRRCR